MRIASGHRCDGCGGPVTRLDTKTRGNRLASAKVIALRVFRCLAPLCGQEAATVEISIGKTTKGYVRDRSEARGTAGYESDDAVVLEDLARRLAFAAL